MVCIEQPDAALLELLEIAQGERTCDAPALLQWERRTARLCGWVIEEDLGAETTTAAASRGET